MVGAFRSHLKLLAIPVLVLACSSVWAVEEAEQFTRKLEFRDLGFDQPIKLLGVDTEVSIPFGLRLDETVTAADLQLKLNLSPALLPRLSHVNVRLNGEFVSTLQVRENMQQLRIDQRLALDPRLFSDYNQLSLQLVGHYTLECEDATHSSLWVQVSPDSALEMTLEPLNIRAGLGAFPVPFFDQRDNRRLELPFVFAAMPDLETVKSAGVLASWFGQQASYRSARFPVSLGTLPDRHAVMLVTNKQLPDWLKLKPVKKPTVSILSQSEKPHLKLLVLQGADAEQLRQAVTGVIYGHGLMTGSQAVVDQVNEPPAREIYDVPAWIRTDREVRLGELVDNPLNLQVKGHRPLPIRVNARIPPDLYTGFYEGVDIDLKYRYTKPVERDNSSLTIFVNGSFVQSFRLESEDESKDEFRLRLPLLDNERFLSQTELLIPAFQLGSDNQMQFQFSLDYHQEGRCKDTPTEDVHAALDPDSTIDLTGFPHYTHMPNLALFANAGYPFTRYADLSETVVLLPEGYSANDVETMLFMLGRMGRMSGLTATRFDVQRPSTLEQADVDLLVIGADNSLIEGDGSAQAPLLINQARRTLNTALGQRPDTDSPVAPLQLQVINGGPLGAVVGYESPLSPGRSVVALLGSSDNSLRDVVKTLEDPGRVSSVRGSVVLVSPDSVHSIDTGKTYTVGSLRWWEKLWLYLSTHPSMMTLLGLIAGLLLAILSFVLLRSAAAWRLKP